MLVHAGMAKPLSQLVPPDGGWGWMVVFGVAVCNCTTQSLLSVYGLLFADTLENMGVETTGAGIISNCMVAITNFSGLGIGSIMRRFSYRQVALAGGVLVAVGMFFTSMATSMWHLLISYSVLVGLGLGLMMPSTFVAVNAFFTTARGRAVGLSLAGTGLGQMLMPHAVRLLLDEYGFRGCVLVLSAVALHALPGALLFHPLRWHAKPAPLPEQEMMPLNVACPSPPRERKARIVTEKQDQKETNSLTINLREKTNQEKVPVAACSVVLVPGSPALNHSSSTSTFHDVTIASEHLPVVLDLKDDKYRKKKVEEVLEKHQPAVSEKPQSTSAPKRKSDCYRWIRLLDLDLLSDPAMFSLLTGLAAVYTAGVNFNMLFPFFLKSHVGLPRGDVALCMSFMAGFDISSRLLLPAFTDRLRVPARVTFLVGSLLLAASRSLMALQNGLPGLLATTALCGFVRGGTIVNLNLAISESCSPERLPGALGMNMVIKGISILVLGIFIGWLRDATGSFTLCIHLLSLCIVVPMCVWIVEIWIERRKRHLHPSHCSLQEPSTTQLPERNMSPSYNSKSALCPNMEKSRTLSPKNEPR